MTSAFAVLNYKTTKVHTDDHVCSGSPKYDFKDYAWRSTSDVQFYYIPHK